MATHLHIVWSPATGPIDGYTNPELAHAHARTMIGVDVATCKMDEDPLDGVAHVIWSPTRGPFLVYRDPGPAWSCAPFYEAATVSPCSVRSQLADVVRDDLNMDYDDDDNTPLVKMDDIDG